MKYSRISYVMISVIIGIAIANARNPTDYTFAECQGSAMPYPTDLPKVSYPDSLVPVMINHVGRHGARYASSPSSLQKLKAALIKAREEQSITPLGNKLLRLVDSVMAVNDGRWGELDSLGEAEQCGIAQRMYRNFREVFDTCQVNAISSYVPRAMMSMYVFNHQLDLLDNKLEFTTTTGRENSALMRPFDLSTKYQEFTESAAVEDTYQEYFERNCPVSAIRRVVGDGYQFDNMGEMRDVAFAEYKALNGLQAMSIPCNLEDYFTSSEINALWRCFNLRQYLDHSASAISAIPADIAADLLKDIIDTTDSYICGRTDYKVWLRFGHAETLMPLLALMRIPGCYYISTDYEDIYQHWRDFDIVPMAANLQMILLKSPASGEYYLMTLLNERPIKLIPDSESVIIPWTAARAYLVSLISD